MIASTTWIGVAAVIAAIGSATSAILGAITNYATRRVEKTVTEIKKNGNGDH